MKVPLIVGARPRFVECAPASREIPGSSSIPAGGARRGHSARFGGRRAAERIAAIITGYQP